MRPELLLLLPWLLLVALGLLGSFFGGMGKAAAEALEASL